MYLHFDFYLARTSDKLEMFLNKPVLTDYGYNADYDNFGKYIGNLPYGLFPEVTIENSPIKISSYLDYDAIKASKEAAEVAKAKNANELNPCNTAE